ncbi:hypothetical protein ACQU0X_26535 [Pseudovibrio ascidiaceicola]|uniref:hypothetical protein n=1 Tax=Pseudovibrio ascidiaceicola TaxID=285279 RepID=UPI003D3682EE
MSTVLAVSRLIQKKTGLTTSEILTFMSENSHLTEKKNVYDATRELSEILIKRIELDGPPALTPETLKEAREMLCLTLEQFVVLCGFKKHSGARSAMCSLEAGRKPISPHVQLLVRAYLSGYRPPNYPNPRKKPAERRVPKVVQEKRAAAAKVKQKTGAKVIPFPGANQEKQKKNCESEKNGFEYGLMK